MKFEDLYGNIAPRLTNYLVSSGSSYAEACDLVQDVFLKIWNMREDLNGSEESVSGLAFTMARNLRKNMFRHNSRITFTDTIPEDAEPNVDNTKAITSSDAAYLRQRLNKAFAALPPTLREAYVPGGRTLHKRDSPRDGSRRKSRESEDFPRQREAQAPP